ncbi:MAG TPA: PIN domain-containing protein [Syntrophomonadaceae bacterium]|nr:PIN domain-containing protein [Syntrophomonadaceae bacterium]HPR92837.1 PIN domain-containing protein [Syntrophomonadaceae bacterium]
MAEKNQIEHNSNILKDIFPDASTIFSFSPSTVNQIKDDCMVVVDTNALLVPYTVSKSSLDTIKDTYARLIDNKQLFIPGHVAREFAKNRAEKIKELYHQLSSSRSKQPQLLPGNYPLLASLQEYNEVVNIEKQINELLRQYRKSIEQILQHIRTWSWDDPVSSIYSQLFNGSVICDPDFKQEIIDVDLKWRNDYKIPPGYKDGSKSENAIGDLLIWHTILHVGQEHKKPIIFVSGDEKADWWYHSDTDNLFPRYELVDEYRRKSGGYSFQIVKFSTFLDIYGASAKAVEEVRNEELRSMVQRAGRVNRASNNSLFYVVKEAVLDFIVNKYQAAEIITGRNEVPDIIVKYSTLGKIGVEIKSYFKESLSFTERKMLRNIARYGQERINMGDFDNFIIALAGLPNPFQKDIVRSIKNFGVNVLLIGLSEEGNVIDVQEG